MPIHPSLTGVASAQLSDLNQRSRDIFKRIVESYLDSGEPVGSRHLSKLLQLSLSPASIRNTMQDLTQLGLLGAPHVSAGRLPTQPGSVPLRQVQHGVSGAVNATSRSAVHRRSQP